MSIEHRETEKQIRSIGELMEKLGYNLAEEDSKHSPYRSYEKLICKEPETSGRISVTETRIGSKHVSVAAGCDGWYTVPQELEKTMEGLELPNKRPEGYKNADLESGGYNKILEAIKTLESDGFFAKKASELRASIEETATKKELLLERVMEEILPSVKKVLPGFDTVENEFLENGTIYLFAKTESSEKIVAVVKISMNVQEMTMQIVRSGARINKEEIGLVVDKNVFEKTRPVKKGKYQFPYYVWEGNIAELDDGIKKLDWFMSEMNS